jgi:hypothetical protein
MPQNPANVTTIGTFIEIAYKAFNVSKLQCKEVEVPIIFKIELNIIILYSMTLVILSIVCKIIIRNKKINLYEPEIAGNQDEIENTENL